jgi:hypothetical protein
MSNTALVTCQACAGTGIGEMSEAGYRVRVTRAWAAVTSWWTASGTGRFLTGIVNGEAGTLARCVLIPTD